MSSNKISTASRIGLLSLPLEIREQIYHHYFEVEGGYIYDSATETLTQIDGKPVDVALRYACRSIADETRHLPFQLNSIKFSTVYRDDWQQIAGTLIWTIHFHKRLQMALLEHLRHHITPDMYQPSNPEYLDYMPAIKRRIDTVFRLVAERPGREYSDFWPCQGVQKQDGYRRSDEDHQISATPRTMREYADETIVFDRTVAYLLQILAERHPYEFDRAVDLALPGWTNSHRGSEVLDLTFKPWAIPSISEVTKMARDMQLQGAFDRFTSWGKMGPDFYRTMSPTSKYQYRKRAFFSATSVAIRFLSRIPEQQRLSIRKIILDENRPSVSLSMCHANGLIPFCNENGKLRIEHRWNLWTTLLLGISGRSTISLATNFETPPETIQDRANDPDRMPWAFDEVRRGNFASAFSAWTMSVLDIVKSGMPLESYTVVIEGDPDLNHSTFAFHTVMEGEIAWLTLNTDCVARGLFAPPDHPDYPMMTRTSEEEALSTDTRSSLIQCNFTLDQSWDLDKIVEKYSVQHEPTQRYRRCNMWSDMEDFDTYYFRVSTDILDFKSLQLLWVEQKPIPEEAQGTEQEGKK
ncbi:hypothetical protein NW768_004938 [Fusarium equiseti]|uniref:Uncharacterized protein n=1 Tax=Fusarium equiseti TaxID=61235 RepID=A0ABQ8RHM5_FUSEQ|nr:hypothetical protein NW768_004938 [Fusarium equiseti]